MPHRAMDDTDVIRMKHMRDAALEALSFIEGKSREELDTNRQLTLSLIKEIEIIGEAASRVSEPTRKKYKDIPWSAIVGIRKRLIHGYFNVDEEIVWNTVKEELPRLIKKLEDALGDKG